MPWNSTWPQGSLSVKSNRASGNQNTTYIETTASVDHFWNESANKDGHHLQVQMPMQGTPAVPTDPTLATEMDGVFYYKAKSATEAPDNQDVQPFFINNEEASTPGVTQIMQLLGIRVCGVFSVSGGVVTVEYSHNLTSITRNGTGVFTVVFPSLPTNNYLVLGDGVANSSSSTEKLDFYVQGSTSLSTVKSKTSFKFRTNNSSGLSADPLQCWFVCFGG